MGSIYYQQNKNLDSLSDVSGFSSALNGKTYGFKKQYGRFVPEDISSGSGSISGIIPDGGLYLDGVNRVGVLINDGSGLQVNNSGLSVLADSGGGLEKSINGLKIKESDSIDPSGPNVKTNGSLVIDSSGVGVKAGNNIVVSNDGVSVNKGAGFSASNTTLDIGAGSGISVNENNISVRYDNSTITAPGGVLQANFGTIPAFSEMFFDNLFPDQAFGGFGTNTVITSSGSGSDLEIHLPNNWGMLIWFSIDIQASASGTFMSSIRPEIKFDPDSTPVDRFYVQRMNWWQGTNDGTSRSGTFYTSHNINAGCYNVSGADIGVKFTINHTGPNGTGMSMSILQGIVSWYKFPISI
jgi:hypothetical protein